MIIAEYTLPGIHVRDHRAEVPLDWSDDRSPALSVFARELVDPGRRTEELPCLVYLQGGPGGKAPRPVGRPGDGWLGQALKTHRVILLDQRGTGRSTPLDGAVMESFGSACEAADHLCHFRADSIVKDAEHLRKTIFGATPWTTLGQSYGGFLTLTYLSQAPEGLSACLVTGGLASVTPDATEVYRRTYPRTEAKNRLFQRRYPHDTAVVARVADRVAAGDVTLPDGDVLTVRRLQTLGLDFGMKPGFERMHWLFDEAFADESAQRLSAAFLSEVGNRTAFMRQSALRRHAGVDLRERRERPDGVGRRTGAGEPPGLRRGRQAAAVHRRDDVPLDVRGDPRAAPLRPRRGPAGGP